MLENLPLKFREGGTRNMSTIYAAVNGYLELTLLKDRQRFDTISTSNLEGRRRILRCINFDIGESSPNLFLNMMNLYLVKFEAQ